MEPDRDGLSVVVRDFRRYLCGMPCAGHRGDAKHDTDFCEADRIPAWTGDRNPGSGFGKVSREPGLFYTAGISVWGIRELGTLRNEGTI